MPLTKTADWRATGRQTRAMAYQAMKETPVTAWLEKVFWIIQSNSREEVINFLRGLPKMREWIGERKIKSMATASFKIEKKDWEATVAIERDDIFFDKLGLIRPNIRAMGTAYPRHFIDLFTSLLLAGFTELAYDGQFFFDTDHDAGDGTSFSNKSTAVFSEAAWITARNAPAMLQDPDSDPGDYLGVQYDTIFYAIGAETVVNQVFNMDEHPDGTPNPYFNQIKKENQVLLKTLGNTNKWFLFDTSLPLKPFLLMIVKALDIISKDSPDDEAMFWRKQAVFGIDSMDQAGFALYELAYGSNV